MAGTGVSGIMSLLAENQISKDDRVSNQLCVLNLVHSLLAKDRVKLLIVDCQLVNRLQLLLPLVHKLTDTGGIIHRLMLQSRETIVQNTIANVQTFVLIFHTTSLIFKQFDVRLALLILLICLRKESLESVK